MVLFHLANVQTLPFGALPADADGVTQPPASAPEYYAVVNGDPSTANNDQLGVWASHVDWSSPGGSTFTNRQNLSVAAFDAQGVSVPQPGVLRRLACSAESHQGHLHVLCRCRRQGREQEPRVVRRPSGQVAPRCLRSSR